jgi:hypothetical protein
MKSDLNTQVVFNKTYRRFDTLNTWQYPDRRYEAFANDDIDWIMPSVTRLASTDQHTNLSTSVSDEPTSRYFIRGSNHKKTTAFPFPSAVADTKGFLHFNQKAKAADNKFTLKFPGNLMADNNQLPQIDLTQNALLLDLKAPPFLNEDGRINRAPGVAGNTTLNYSNIMIQQHQKYVNKTCNLVSSLSMGYALFSGPDLKNSFGFNYLRTTDFSPDPLILSAPELRATTQ